MEGQYPLHIAAADGSTGIISILVKASETSFKTFHKLMKHSLVARLGILFDVGTDNQEIKLQNYTLSTEMLRV